MRQNYRNLIEEVESKLKLKNENQSYSLEALKEIRNYLENKAFEVNNWLREYHFENAADEIYFFKNIKSKLSARILQYKQMFDIELKKPIPIQTAKEYYNILLRKYTQIPKKQRQFYKYFRSQATHRDTEYYLRESNLTNRHDQYLFVFFDNKITTKKEYLLAEFIANEYLIKYIENELALLNKPGQLPQTNEVETLEWTGTNLDFIELIYGLYHNKAISDGKCDVKKIARAIGKTFDINMEDNLYRYFIDIKRRKKEKTLFLNSMVQSLSKVLESEI